jgi:hypothetical protein
MGHWSLCYYPYIKVKATEILSGVSNHSLPRCNKYNLIIFEVLGETHPTDHCTFLLLGLITRQGLRQPRCTAIRGSRPRCTTIRGRQLHCTTILCRHCLASRTAVNRPDYWSITVRDEIVTVVHWPRRGQWRKGIEKGWRCGVKRSENVQYGYCVRRLWGSKWK